MQRREHRGDWTWASGLRSSTAARFVGSLCRRQKSVVFRAVTRLASTVLPGYTSDVKTAISVPDDTFDEATKQASELGISRSEFFTRAARRYLDELASRSLTEQVNEALQTAGTDDSADAAVAAGRELLTEDDW
jgi:hypothetical protein